MLTVLLAVLLVPVLGLLVARYGLLRRPEGWEFFPNQRYPLSNRRIDVVYGKRADGGCEFHHPLQQASDQPLLQARMLGIDHRDCTILMEVGVPAR